MSDLEIADRLRRDGLRLYIGPFVTRIRVTLPGLAEHIRFLYTDTPLDDSDGLIDFDIKLGPPPGIRRWLGLGATVYVDDVMQFMPFDPAIAVPMFEWGINWCVFNRPHQYLILHAAVLERGGHAVIMPGPPGSGKSTLCAALSLRGWRLLSDEVAMIRPSDRMILPLPRPVGLKEESIEVIRRFEPSAFVSRPWPGTKKGTIAHMRMPPESVARAGEMASPAWIVCPKYTSGATSRFEPIHRSQAMLYAADDAFNYSLLARVGFETLADVVESCGCFEFTYDDLDAAVKAFDELVPTMSTPMEGVGA